MTINLKSIFYFSVLFFFGVLQAAEYLGNYNAGRFDPNSVDNPYGKYGNPHAANSINNKYGVYGSSYSNKSVHNPHATNAPKLYGKNGNYRGRLSCNPYDPDFKPLWQIWQTTSK